MEGRVVKFTAPAVPKEVAPRTFRFVASTPTVDREGDVIDVNGWDTAAYLRNPVILAAHDYGSFPVARGSRVIVEGGALMVDVTFPPEGTSQASDEAYRLVKTGFLRAVSVGFRPLETPERLPALARGYRYGRNELLEVSLCSVPANAQALIAASYGTRGARRGAPAQIVLRGLPGLEGRQVRITYAQFKDTVSAAVARAIVRRVREDAVANVATLLRIHLVMLGRRISA